MAISPNCLLTIPSVALVTSSLFYPPQQHSLSSLGPGQRRLRQQPTAESPTPRSPTRSPTASSAPARASTPHSHSTEQVIAHVQSCQPFVTPLLENDLPITQENDKTCLTATLRDYLQWLGEKKTKQNKTKTKKTTTKSLLEKSECMRKKLPRSTKS